VPIIDPGIAQRQSGYSIYDDAVKKDILIKAGDQPLTGNVWPVDSVFVDFMQQVAVDQWKIWLTNFFAKFDFDGIWLDMNEVENFCDGWCYFDQQPDYNNDLEWTESQLPYTPGQRSLNERSLLTSAKHKNGVRELDAHSLYASMEVQATKDWFDDQDKRSFILSRSGFAGIGKGASRYLGDNFSTAEMMGFSVTGIMAQNVMGIPLSGADVCGFFGNTTADLCAHWYTVAAFQPLSRNHNNINNMEQSPWSFSNPWIGIIRNAMDVKLSLVRYFYSVISNLHTQGGTFYKPLFFEFPDDAGAYEAQQLNVMLGSALKLGIQSIAVDQDSSEFYYPAGLWCDVYNQD